MPAEAVGAEPLIRHESRPGDAEAIGSLHRRLYLDRYGLGESFVADVENGVGEALARGWPREREGAWLVERDGRLDGCVALTDEGGGEARLRWVVLDPGLRGAGLGRRLISAAVDHARASGQSRLVLVTFDELTAAAAIYRSLGLRVVGEDRAPRWGRSDLVLQRYELELDPGP